MIAVAAGLGLAATSQADPRPLKVFILAGQSNMEGHARIETFDYIGDDPATAPLLKRMRGTDGKPTVCQGAWISYLTGADEGNFELTGRLTAGFGSMWGLDPGKPGDKIGPEFTFGLTLDTGRYYRLMMEHVKKVLADPKCVVPGYDPVQGYELAGFVWLQGWNDMVDGYTYPAHGKPGQLPVVLSQGDAGG